MGWLSGLFEHKLAWESLCRMLLEAFSVASASEMYELLCLLLCDRADALVRSKGFLVILVFPAHIDDLLLCARNGQDALAFVVSFILHDSPGEWAWCSHFIDEETETQRRERIDPGATQTTQGQSRNGNLSLSFQGLFVF